MELPISNAWNWASRRAVSAICNPVITFNGPSQQIFLYPPMALMTATGRVYGPRDAIPLCNSKEEYAKATSDPTMVIAWIVNRLNERMTQDPPKP